MLHAAVPTIADRQCRRYVLAIKRHVHVETSPLPGVPAGVLAHLPPEVAQLIDVEDTQRRALATAWTDLRAATARRWSNNLRSCAS